MSNRRDEQNDELDRDRFGSLPVLRSWWSELSGPARVLIPTSAVVLVFVSASAFPPLVF